MKSLNRTLSLVLVLVMVLGVFGVAGAAFKDEAQIENAQAVQTAVALNIINGKDGNVFDPTGIVKRGEMAKMITIALNGGAEPVLGTLAAPTFTDIRGHWAEKYIEYCSTLGIINGRGDGTFDPEGTVTGTEAAKMLLVALGFNSEFEKYTGASWALNVNTRATSWGIYEDLAIDPNGGLTRDNAAQMVYNTLYADMVEYDYGIAPGAGGVTGVAKVVNRNTNLMKTAYKLVEETGQLTAITYNETKKEYTYTVTGATSPSFTSTTDYSALFAMNVKVFWRDKVASNGNFKATEDTVFDIVADGSSVVAKGTNGYMGKYTAATDTLQFALSSVKLNSGLTVHTGFSGISTTGVGTGVAAIPGMDASFVHAGSAAPVATTYEITLIDNDGDGKVDTIHVVPFSVAAVSFAGTSNVNLTNAFAADGTTPVPSVKPSETIVYDGIAKDDIVAYYAKTNTAKDTATLVKQNIITGTVTGTKTGMFQVNGMWMSRADARATIIANDGTTKTFALAAGNPQNGDTIAYVAVGVFAPFTKVTTAAATSNNVLAVETAADTTSITGLNAGVETLEARVIFTDGTKKDVKIAKYDGTEIKAAGSAATGATALATTNAGGAYTYITNSDGEYILTTVANASNKAGFDAVVDRATVTGYNATTKQVNGVALADDAKVLAISSHATLGGAKLFTGKEFKNANASNWGTDITVLVSEVNSFSYAKLVVIYDTAALPTSGVGAAVGYLTTDSYSTVVDGTAYLNYVIWTTSGELTVKEKIANPATLKAGILVTFDVVDATTVKNVKEATAPAGSVQGYNEAGKDINISGNSYKMTSDTKVLYVNSATKSKSEGAIAVAGKDALGAWVNNVRFIPATATPTEIAFLLVDTNNNMPALASAGYTATGTAATDQAMVAALFTAYDTVVYSGTAPVGAVFAVPAGKTLEFAAAQTSTILEAVTATAGSKLKVLTSSNGTATTANKWFDKDGVAYVASPAAGANSTDLITTPGTTVIPANTYVYGTYYSQTTNAGDTTGTAWVKA